MNYIIEHKLLYGFIFCFFVVALINIMIIIFRLFVRIFYGKFLISIKAADRRNHIMRFISYVMIIITNLTNLNYRQDSLSYVIKYMDSKYLEQVNQSILSSKLMILIFALFSIISILKFLTKIKIYDKGIITNKGSYKWGRIKSFNWENETEKSIVLRLSIKRRIIKNIRLAIKREDRSLVEEYLRNNLNS